VISLERRDGRPLLIGHRGAAALAPENTLASFRAAVAAGVDLVEFDVIRLRGGELVVAHSHDLFEVSHGAMRGSMRNMRVEELRDACPDLPTLDQALEFFASEAPETGVHVDLKAAAAAEAVSAALDRFGLCGRSLVSSFHHDALRRLSRLEPDLRCGVSFPRDRLGVHRRKSMGPVVGGSLRALGRATPRLVDLLLTRSRANTLVLHHALVSAAAVGRAHARRAPVIAWTVDDPQDFRRVEDAGVDAIVTNNPSIFVSTLMTT
jgi:glycerophosphoryl diester phosphodiesterase